MATHLDQALLAELHALMGDDFALLLETYLEESGREFEAANRACANGDLDALRRNAHSLKGSALNIGAFVLSELCAQLEARARDEAQPRVARLLEQAGIELSAVQAEVSEVRQQS